MSTENIQPNDSKDSKLMKNLIKFVLRIILPLQILYSVCLIIKFDKLLIPIILGVLIVDSFLGLFWVAKNIDSKYPKQKYVQHRSAGILMYYVIYWFEFFIHFVVSLITLKQWYFELNDIDFTAKDKLKKCYHRAKLNVCFNQSIKYGKTGFYDWIEFLFDETR